MPTVWELPRTQSPSSLAIMAPKTSDHTPMTRPRISSGTIVCSTVFDVEKKQKHYEIQQQKKCEGTRKVGSTKGE